MICQDGEGSQELPTLLLRNRGQRKVQECYSHFGTAPPHGLICRPQIVLISQLWIAARRRGSMLSSVVIWSPLQDVRDCLDREQLQHMLDNLLLGHMRLRAGVLGGDKHTDSEFLPPGDHVDDAGQLQEEQAGRVSDISVVCGKEVDQPHVQIQLLLYPRAKNVLRVRFDEGALVEELEVPGDADILLHLQDVTNHPDELYFVKPDSSL